MSETVIYKGISGCDIQKQIELQQWIIDPSSRPYPTKGDMEQLITRSAGIKQIEKKLTIEQCIEIQKKILGDS